MWSARGLFINFGYFHPLRGILLFLAIQILGHVVDDVRVIVLIEQSPILVLLSPVVRPDPGLVQYAERDHALPI